jgi:S-adenosylmethionine synthetase
VTGDTFGTGTGTVPEAQIGSAVRKVCDLTPGGIVTTLDLLMPIYRNTAAYGHFGRSEFGWERSDRVGELQGGGELKFGLNRPVLPA